MRRDDVEMSDEYEDRVRRFEARVRAALDEVGRCVREVAEANDDSMRYLIAERLLPLGSAALPGLLAILQDTRAQGDAGYLAAWVAVELGDRSDAAQVLIEHVEQESKWTVPAAAVLGRHHIEGAEEAILHALMRVDVRDGVAVAGLSEALKATGSNMPNALRARLIRETDPWIGRAVEQDFPLA